MRVFVTGGTGAIGGHAIQARSPVHRRRRPRWRNNDRVRIQGSAAVVDGALAAGVGRVVQESVSMLYRDQGARWVDENTPIDRYPMAQGNIAAEQNAHRFSPSGGTGIVMRFGWFYGPSR